MTRRQRSIAAFRVNLGQARLDNWLHRSLRHLMVQGKVDAATGCFEIAQHVVIGRHHCAAEGVDGEEFLGPHGGNKSLAAVDEGRQAVAGAFLRIGHQFASDGIDAFERGVIGPFKSAEVSADSSQDAILCPQPRHMHWSLSSKVTGAAAIPPLEPHSHSFIRHGRA
ncbi:MAG: hypothetical protein ABI563_18185 [Specibacter sp.]